MSLPIRILQVFGRMDRGGAETMLMNLYRNIDRNKIQFDFIVHTNDKCAYDSEIEALGGKIYHCPQYRVWNHWQYVLWWKDFFLKHSNYRILHSHIRSSAVIFFKIAKKRKIITIAHSHSTSNGTGMRSFIKNMLQRNLTKYADFCFACGKESGKWLYKDREFFILNNAIDANKFIFDMKKRNEIRKEFHFSEKDPVIGTIGRLTLAKNPIEIIEIIKALYKIKPEIKFLWIGEGEMHKEIENRITQEGLNNSVILTGVRKDIDALLQALDVFIMPSLWEGLPVVGIEAQAAGVPCLFSENITREIEKTKVCQFLPLGKPEIWVSNILECLNNKHENTYEDIVKVGYDIKENVVWLQNFYETNSK